MGLSEQKSPSKQEINTKISFNKQETNTKTSSNKQKTETENPSNKQDRHPTKPEVPDSLKVPCESAGESGEESVTPTSRSELEGLGVTPQSPPAGM